MAEIQKNCNEETSFDEQLKCLREQLLTSQSALQQAESEIQEGEAQIDALSTFISEFDQIVADYTNAFPTLLEKQSLYERICKDETSCLESILGEDCAYEVCRTVERISHGVSTLESDIKAREESLTGAKKVREEYEKKRDKAKGDFEQWKEPKKSIESRFKSLDQFKKEFDKERDEHHDTIAYYLLNCTDKFCSLTKNEPKVYAVDEFIDKLKCAWKEYVKADSCFNEQDAKVKGLEQQLATIKTQLETDKKNLETTIRRKLIELANSKICSTETESDNCTQT